MESGEREGGGRLVGGVAFHRPSNINHHVVSLLRVSACSLHGQPVLPLLFAVVDSKHLCELDVVEASLPIREWPVKQTIDLFLTSAASSHTITERDTAHLPIVHPIAELPQPLAHLRNLDKPLVTLIKARKRLSHVRLRVQLEQVFPHHRQELREVDPAAPARPSPASWPRQQQGVQQTRRGRLAFPLISLVKRKGGRR